jgi:hypothetical protein
MSQVLVLVWYVYFCDNIVAGIGWQSLLGDEVVVWGDGQQLG